MATGGSNVAAVLERAKVVRKLEIAEGALRPRLPDVLDHVALEAEFQHDQPGHQARTVPAHLAVGEDAPSSPDVVGGLRCYSTNDVEVYIAQPAVVDRVPDFTERVREPAGDRFVATKIDDHVDAVVEEYVLVLDAS